MGIYASVLRTCDRKASDGFYTEEEINLLREVHRRVSWQLQALRGGEMAAPADSRENHRVAAAIFGLAQAGVTDPSIIEGMALRALAARRDAAIPGNSDRPAPARAGAAKRAQSGRPSQSPLER
jgi:hypothetical protein